MKGTKVSMAELWNQLMSNGDPRVANWPLMQGPLPTALICLAYVLFVKVVGPKLMENRKPFDLRLTLIVYNFLMMTISLVLFAFASKNYWLNDYSWTCEPVDYSSSPKAMVMAKLCYLYYLLKFVELLDTVFFVLRKKRKQISTLHVIHHGLMPFSVWWGVKFAPGGHVTFFGYINTGVHIFVYTYYGLSALGPRAAGLLWWKKYLTRLQMIQFVLIFVHSTQLLFWKDCNFPKAFGVFIAAHGTLFWILFYGFYLEAYCCRSSILGGGGGGARLWLNACLPGHTSNRKVN